jgi:hypothetical protein
LGFVPIVDVEAEAGMAGVTAASRIYQPKASR